MIIVGFFVYKSKENQFEIEGFKKMSSYNNLKNTYEMVFRKNANDWFSRPIFWKMSIVIIFWPFMLPFLAIIKGLNLIYNKLNINNFKIFKKDEEYRKHFEDKHGINSADKFK